MNIWYRLKRWTQALIIGFVAIRFYFKIFRNGFRLALRFPSILKCGFIVIKSSLIVEKFKFTFTFEAKYFTMSRYVKVLLPNQNSHIFKLDAIGHIAPFSVGKVDVFLLSKDEEQHPYGFRIDSAVEILEQKLLNDVDDNGVMYIVNGIQLNR